MAQSNLLSLQIKFEEALRTSNLTRGAFNAVASNAATHSQRAIGYCICGFLLTNLAIFLYIFFPAGISMFTAIAFWIISIPYAVESLWMPQFHKFRHKFRHLKNLYQEIQNFNSLIEGVDALDQAERSGGIKRLENKEKVIEALTVIRADLLCALKIEKAFRENPNFSSNGFSVNLEPLKYLQLSEKSGEYGRLFNEALQIGMSIQEEMQLLKRK